MTLLSENRLEWLYCDFGIQAAGAITVPIYPNTLGEMAQRIASDCQATFAIASNASMTAKLKVVGPLQKVALIEVDVANWVGQGPQRLAEVMSRLGRISPDDVCTIVYTSGTTGDPKGAELAHRNLVDISRTCVQVHPLSEEDSTLSFLPYAHVFERINGISSRC